MRYFIDLSYNGKNYNGWQRQPNAQTVQETIEIALSTILRTETGVVGAGRTDTGVHAKAYTLHFESEIEIDAKLLTYKLNSLLPLDIAISAIYLVDPSMHARFDAISRTYEYHIVLGKNPFVHEYAMKIISTPNFELMNEACNLLLKHKDFTSFSKLHTDVNNHLCNVTEAYWKRKDNSNWVFTISANRFLRNMVRAIVGTLLDVGYNKISIEEFNNIFIAKDRCKAGTSVPAHGLFLTAITYT